MKMSKSYLAKEAKEKPYSQMSAKEKAHEKKETPLHERIEHGGKKILKQWNKALGRKK